MSTDNGGPAFPTTEANYTREYSDTGMTMRDYFAAKAPITTMDAMVACGFDTASIGTLSTESLRTTLKMLAIMRGAYADAMLAERAK